MFVEKFDGKLNFWKAYPQLKLYFKDIISKDKSSGKEHSSKIMWAVAMVYDPDSDYRKLPESERIALVEDEWLESKGLFSKDKSIADVCAVFVTLVDNSAAKRHLRAWEKLIENRTGFLLGSSYGPDTWEMLDKMAGATKKIFEEYKLIQKLFQEEELRMAGEGNTELSMLDTDEE